MKLVTKDDKQSYKTHYNYIKCLSRLISGSTLKSNLSLTKDSLKFLDQKRNLIDLTRKSLKDEYGIVCIDNEYSYASTSWLPVKTYYLLFNQLLTIEYIIKNDKNVFNTKHIDCVNIFTEKLKTKEIEFSDPILNQVFDKSILSYSSKTSGANLSHKTKPDVMYKLIMKKIAEYKLKDWQRVVAKTESFRSIKDKQKKLVFLNKLNLSIFDFLYCMRIRANYRDFAFIDGISPMETANYFKEYYNFSISFFNLLKKLEISLTKMRY
ncbi:hypothetical protein M0R01_01880 [bacterium]|nr:hypothetical protein [bacterium]